MLLSKSVGYSSYVRRSVIKCRCSSENVRINSVPKEHYDYKRMVFDSFIYNPYEHLTQTELRSLVKDHKIRIQCRKNRLYLSIYPEKWGDKEYEVWDYLVGILNDWNLMNLLREELSIFPEKLDAQLIIPLNMQFIRVNTEETKYDDWIDHA